jgi:ribosomal protein S18 acetylase RimI-like enzyme
VTESGVRRALTTDQSFLEEMFYMLFAEASPRFRTPLLSVSRENPVRRLYERLGFQVVREDERPLVMLKSMER